jgi:HK97 family phage prohead protease
VPQLNRQPPRRPTRELEPEQLVLRADIVPESWSEDSRSVRVRWTAGADVKRYDWESGRYYWERLDFAPGAVDISHLNSGRCVVLDNHQRWSVRDAVGRVDANSASIDVQGRTAEATVIFTKAADAQPVVERVKDGTVTGFSFGYERLSVERTEEMREGYPIYYVRRWRVKELSPTPMPADEGAGTRAGDEHGQVDLPENTNGGDAPQRNQNMPPEIADTTKDEQARAAELKAAEERAATAERARAKEIRDLCRKHKMDAAFETRVLDGEQRLTADQVRTLILEERAKKDEETNTRSQHSGGFQVGPADNEKFARVLADSLALRAGAFRSPQETVPVTDENIKERSWLRATKPLEGAHEFAGLRLAQLAGIVMQRAGVDCSRMSDAQLWDKILDQRSIAPGHGTADFVALLANVAHKQLRRGSEESPSTYQSLVRTVQFTDFKPRSVPALGSMPDLKRIGENGEVSYGAFGETNQTWAIADYERAIAITRKALINDDLSAFERVPRMMGMAAMRLRSDIVWALRTAQQVLEETGLGLYNVAHVNTGTGAITVAALNTGYATMAMQRGPTTPEGVAGPLLNIMPRFLIVPPALMATAVQMTASLLPNTQAAVNPFAQGGKMPLTVIAEPRLQVASTTQWYLDADPNEYDTMEVGELAGQSGPYIEQRVGFERSGLELKVRDTFGASWIDFRGTYRSTGA